MSGWPLLLALAGDGLGALGLGYLLGLRRCRSDTVPVSSSREQVP